MNMGYNERRTLAQRSLKGKIGTTLPKLDVPVQDMPNSADIRTELFLPEISEGEVVRYMTSLSQMNFSIDTNYYPLGSCTMKYNPKVNEEMANLPGFANIHPRQPSGTVQGALELAYKLQEILAEIVGMSGCSLSTMAGAQGELAGMLMIRAYHVSRGDHKRKFVLIPDSAHGTNPASAAMCGYEVVTIPSDFAGNMDVDALRAACNGETVGLMLTLPNTLGLFDTNILEICKLVHDCGGLVYGDGANMNAMLGRTKLGHLGFDVMHFNLHKTFSTPHGGGGPGSGPVCARDILVPFLPSPVIRKNTSDKFGHYDLYEPDTSIGKTSAFHYPNE